MPRQNYSTYHDNMEEISDSFSDVTVVDVYDIASDIGKECEKIIDLYGANAVTGLMPKVINALELLENLATRNERENTQLLELQTKISQLENDKLEKAEYREKFEKELENIEDQWRSETKDLVEVVSRLQEENRKLLREQNNSPSTLLEGDSPVSDSLSNGEVLQRLKDTIEKQRDEMRLKEKLLQDKTSDIDNLKSQVDRLMSSSRDSKRKHKTLQLQVRTLCDERADFLVQLQDQQRDITALRQRLGLAEKENEDLSKLDLALPSNKAIYDLDDPNRPRFTTQELKDILNERNELKAKVSDLEDELETYRPKPKPESNIRKFVNSIENACDTLINSLQKTSQNVSSTIIPSPPIEDDAPVQGPLPLEPDDAPWKKSESGIRKLIFKLRGTGTPVNTGVFKDITVKIKSLGKNSFENITVFGNYLQRGTVLAVFQDVACQLSQRCLSRLLMSQSPSNQLNPHHMYHSMFHIDPAGNIWFT